MSENQIYIKKRKYVNIKENLLLFFLVDLTDKSLFK